MSEQEQQPRSPEHGQEGQRPVFNFEDMDVKTALLLDEAIGAALDRDMDRFIYLSSAFEKDLDELPGRNIERARELIIALAESDAPENRCAAAQALKALLRSEHELDSNSEHISELTELWISLHREEGREESDGVSETAYFAMNGSLREGWLRPDIAARIDSETED